MTVRRSARWQTSLDERILEYLRDEPWAAPEEMIQYDPIHATRGQVLERCRVLADADLVDFPMARSDILELTSLGRNHLNGGIDVSLHPQPRHPRRLELEV